MSPVDRLSLVTRMGRLKLTPEMEAKMLLAGLPVDSETLKSMFEQIQENMFEQLQEKETVSTSEERTFDVDFNTLAASNAGDLTNALPKPVGRSADEKRALDDLWRAYKGVDDLGRDFNLHFKSVVTADVRDILVNLGANVPLQTKVAVSSGLVRDEDGVLKGIFRAATNQVVIRKVARVLGAFGFDSQSFLCGKGDACGQCSHKLDELVGNVLGGKPLDNQKLQEAIAGVMQCGKGTCFSTLMLILPPIVFVATRGRVKPISFLTLPADSTIRQGILLDIEGGMAAFGKLIFRNGDFACSVHDYWYQHIQKANSDIFYNPNLFEELILLRTPKNLEARQKMEQLLASRGCTAVFMFHDECHFGAKKDSIQDKLSQPVKLPGGQVTIHEFGISATPDELLSKEVRGFWNIDFLPIEADFVGPGHINGIQVPTIGCDGPAGIPRVESIDVYLWEKGDIYMHQDSFFYESTYRKTFPGDARTWKDYRKAFIDRLAKIIIQNLDYAKGKKAVFLRLSKNKHCEEIKVLLSKRLEGALNKKVECVDFFGPGNYEKKVPAVKTLCNPVFSRNRYAIILASGRGRLSSQFGAWCHTFIDLTVASSTADSLMQGTIGRACGYGKMIDGQAPLVLVLPTFLVDYDVVKSHNFDLSTHPKGPGINTISTKKIKNIKKKGCGTGRKEKYAQANPIKNNQNPTLCALSKIYNDAWVQDIHDRPTSSKPRSQDKAEQPPPTRQPHPKSDFQELGRNLGLSAKAIKKMANQATKQAAKEVAKAHGPNLLFNTFLKNLFTDELIDLMEAQLGPELEDYRLMRWGEEFTCSRFGANRVETDCKACQPGKPCGNHHAYIFDTKTVSNDIQVGITISNVPPAWTKLQAESADPARQAGSGNAARAPKQKRKDATLANPIAVKQVFADKECPVCRQNISTRLWTDFKAHIEKKNAASKAETKKIHGHWPEEIRQSCCFQNSEVELVEIQWPLKEKAKVAEPQNADEPYVVVDNPILLKERNGRYLSRHGENKEGHHGN